MGIVTIFFDEKEALDFFFKINLSDLKSNESLYVNILISFGQCRERAMDFYYFFFEKKC
jgi:hypothetical protein